MPPRQGLTAQLPALGGFQLGLQAALALLALSLAVLTIGFSLLGWSQSSQAPNGKAEQGGQPFRAQQTAEA